MKKRIHTALAALLACVVLCSCGGTALAADGKTTGAQTTLTVTASADATKAQAGEVSIVLSDKGSSASDESVLISGSTVTITQEGDYRITGTLSDGQIVIQADDTAKVKLILDGADITSKGSAAIYALSADKVVLSSAAGSVSSLSSVGAFVQTDDNNVDAAVYAKTDLNLSGEGTVLISSAQGHGVVSKDDLKVKDGVWVVEAANKGLSGKDSLTVEDGSVTVTSGGKGLSSGNDEDDSKGSVEILGGSVTVTSEDDSVHADNSVLISGGTLLLASGDDGIHADVLLDISGGSVTVSKSYEGLEAQDITISGGDIDVTASDDGVNVSGGNDGSNAFGPFGGDMFASAGGKLAISGGTLNVDAGGDGLDSNGDIEISGGVTTVSGPTDNGNSALDYNGSGVITGGTLIAAGSTGMAMNFGSGSTQGSILLNLSSAQAAGSSVTVTDESGKVLASYSPSKRYQSIVVSAAGMTKGGSYTVTAGSEKQTVTLTDTIYGSGGMMGGFGGMGGGQRPGGGFGGKGGQFPTDGSFPGDFQPPEDGDFPTDGYFPTDGSFKPRPGGGSKS